MNSFFLKKLALTAALFAVAFEITPAQAASTTFTGSYSQNFDVALTNSATAMPAGFRTLIIAGGNTNFTAAIPISTTNIAAATASGTQTLTVWNSGSAVASSGTALFNIGSVGNLNDRALGTDPTGVGAMVIELSMTNNTGGSLAGVTFSYACKCLTNGSAGTEASELPGYAFFYSQTGSTTPSDWIRVTALANGNFTQGTASNSGPVNITFATPLANNGIMYFRWADDNNEASSPDQMLGIDNISIASFSPGAPQVSITSPANTASFIPDSSIAIAASASESGGTITNVEFYANGTDLGGSPTAPYGLTWPSVPAGSYALTAVASDAGGIQATSAVVNITVAHLAPTVSLTSPVSGAAFVAPASILLAATASDTDGKVTNVAFYEGATLLANVASAPFTYTWPNVPAGSYTLTAVASVDTGASGTSSPVPVTVTNPIITSFTGSYSQNFDLALANGSPAMPAGFLCMQITAGSFTAASPITSTDIASAVAESQTLLPWNAGTAVTKSGTQLYNIGSWDGTSDRALGSDPTGVGAVVIQLGLTNNTGGTIYGVTFSYDCKCLTNGTDKTGFTDPTEDTELPGYSFFYSLTGSTTPSDWIPVTALANGNFTQGTVSNTGPVNITFPAPLTNNGIIYFRWADDDCSYISPDQMIGIDNISIATYSPAGPLVSITSPTNTAGFVPGSDIAITASASESGGTITNVEFYANGTDLGGATTAPYGLTWPSVPAGSYVLTAVASDALGLMTTSSAVNVSVAYATPVVSLTSPADNAAFNTGDSITLSATASSADGTVTNVAFYQGSTLLADVTTAPYTYVWPNVSAGSYTLTAQATDSQGVTGTSSAVSVTVGNPTVTSFTGSYSQNFDQALTNGGTTLPPGFVSMVIAGSHSDYTATAPFTSAAVASATVDTQSLIVWNAGDAVNKSGTQSFNVGSWDSLNDRALGTDPTGTAAQVIQLSMTNNTGGNLYGVVFSYDCKCLTNGSSGDESSELPGYCFFYSLTGGTTAADWTEVGAAGDVPGGTNSSGVPIPNGLSLPNFTQGTTMSSGPVTIMFAAPLTNGGVMSFRWVDDNNVASSPDQMIAIDNIAITAYNPNGPVASLISPTNNANYIPGTDIAISVNASDLGANITNVSLYIDGALEYTFPSAPYTLTIPGGTIPPGSYTLFARVADDAGLTANSPTVNFTVAYVPPTVSLTGPATGSSFPAPASVPLSASAASVDGTITNVAFYQGTTLLANVTTAPFNYTWANVPAGSYNLTAQATDNNGLTATSSVVAVTVTNGFGTPLASITSPANGVNFQPGSDIAISANAIESGGSITNVEFYANSIDLGGVTSAPYNLTWPNVPAGNYALTVVASDAAGLTDTSPVVNITVSAVHVPPTIGLTSPVNNAVLDVASGLSLSATAASGDGTVTNVAFYQNGFLVANVTTAPYNYTWTNPPTGIYTLSAVVTDDSGASTTSSVVHVTAVNSVALATLRQIKTLFIIPLENHDFVQQDPLGSPQQLLGNPACPYFNSLTTPDNSNSVQTAYAAHYFSSAINGEHPSEPNYLWSEAGTDFGIRTDNDPSTGSGNVFNNVQHLSGQLTAAGVPWRSYQEDLEFSPSELVSASGSGSFVNPYNGTTQYSYAVKHNPMAFFTDTQNTNCYPFTNFWTDLTNNNIGRYNWITPNQYNEMHSSLPAGFTYLGTNWTGNQAAIAEGDNFLSIVIPRIMASAAYQDHGAIIIWTDETESTDDTNTTLPFIIISPLVKGNAYASTLPYSHSSDLKTMDEIFGLAYQTNAIPGYLAAQNIGTNYVDGRSAPIYDLSDFFTIPVTIAAGTAMNTGNFQLSFFGPSGQAYEVLATDDLTLPQSEWPVTGTGNFSGGMDTFTDSNAVNHPYRYYIIKSP